ncbi:BolA family protein [Salinisphaera aquimarina]|uniref:BolA family protein n=1 Tax=Salinisphaera aquimarina TaxID=2094031 RepID=A0ABV7EM17_9GAMM
MYSPDSIRELIQEGLPDASVEVMGDDGTHFAARVISASFVGKGIVEQHRMVYATLGARMGEEIHALSLKTMTPEQAGQV